MNDVTAARDPHMSEVVAQANVPIILMHSRGTPRTMKTRAHYRHLIPEIMDELAASIKKVCASGVSQSKILIDPGLGFAKKAEDNLVILKNLSVFKKIGFPVVIGPSRKSFISGDRLFGTAAAVAYGVWAGADIVRVHDVAHMKQVAAVVDSISRSMDCGRAS